MAKNKHGNLLGNSLTRWLRLPALLAMLILASFAAFHAFTARAGPIVTTDKLDYAPEEIVTITGHGFAANTSYDIPVIRPDGSIVIGNGSFTPGSDSVSTDGSGSFEYLYQLDGILGAYQVQVYASPWSGDVDEPALATATFTDAPPANPAGNLDQCANGGVGDPPDTCSGSAWQNGNLNANQAHYEEGDSVPYRLRMSGLATGATVHTVTIEWDTLKSGKHALDYVTSFDRTETTADPCSGVTGCTLAGPKDTIGIPVDANVTEGLNGVDDPPGPSDDIAQIAGDFTLFNGDITSLSTYTVSGGDLATQITISFTTTVANPVLAWGGHIGTRVDWGNGNSAISVPGSPYHMRFIDLDGSGGNQDRSLSAGAVIFPAALTIIKDAVPNDPTDFDFTTTGPEISDFSLDDDAEGTLPNSITFPLTLFGAANTRTVIEIDPSPGFLLTALVCTEDPGGLGQDDNSTTDLGAAEATIIAEEGEIIVCTYTNTRQPAMLTVTKIVTNDDGGTLEVSDFPLFVDGGSVTSGEQNDFDAGKHTVSETGDAGYTATFGGDCDEDGSVTLALGEKKACTITNDDKPGRLNVIKTIAGAPPSGTQSFTFQLRQGASGSSAGTILESATANAGNGGIINFTTLLDANTTYQLCEIVMPGWMTTLGPPFYTVYNPSGDNSTVCTDFTVSLDEKRTFTINNIPPPGGLGRTIGFWKNWASCANSNGRQRPVLDQTLALAEPAGILIGDLTLHGSIATPNQAPDCLKAVRILSKSRINDGKRMSSDPAFNLAAQLLAAKLNVAAGAGACPAAVTAINSAQALLDTINFNGKTHTNMSTAQKNLANSLATTLDRYNNNTLC